jgi:hypothetical protein
MDDVDHGGRLTARMLRAMGLFVRCSGGQLMVGPSKMVSDELRARIIANRDALLSEVWRQPLPFPVWPNEETVALDLRIRGARRKGSPVGRRTELLRTYTGREFVGCEGESVVVSEYAGPVTTLWSGVLVSMYRWMKGASGDANQELRRMLRQAAPCTVFISWPKVKPQSKTPQPHVPIFIAVLGQGELRVYDSDDAEPVVCTDLTLEPGEFALGMKAAAKETDKKPRVDPRLSNVDGRWIYDEAGASRPESPDLPLPNDAPDIVRAKQIWIQAVEEEKKARGIS